MLAVLECTKLTPQEAKVPAHVRLDSIKPGMIVRPALGPRKPDPTRHSVIVDVQQAKTGQSTIRFKAPPAEDKGPPPKEPPEKK